MSRGGAGDARGHRVESAALSRLQVGARDLVGLTLSPAQLDQFEAYYRELVSWNERVNLTAIVDPVEVAVKHFLDSLSCLLAFPPGSCLGLPAGGSPERSWSLIDVGSGAGFPGLPLKMVCPNLSVTCVDSVRKKTAFVQHLVQWLGLQQVEVVTARAEDLAHAPEHRERYDLVVSRAVADLRVLSEYCLPFATLGGLVIAPKGTGIEAEISIAHHAIGILGGHLREAMPIDLPGLEGQRQLVLLDKMRPTPSAYPRRAGIPERRPL